MPGSLRRDDHFDRRTRRLAAVRNSGIALVGFLRTFTWRAIGADSANLVVSLVVGGLFSAATAVALVASLATAWILGAGVLVRAGALRLAARMARFDRRRLQRLGAQVEPLALPEPPPGASFRQRQVAWGTARWLWRLPLYQLVRLPLAGVTVIGAVAWWAATILCFVVADGPSGNVAYLAWHFRLASPGAGEAVGLVMVGIVGILLWPVLVRGAVSLDVQLARGFLGVSRSRRLAAEVSRLSEARALAVESAEAERRRIERDLHDGFQPQLVSLALDLGLARTRLERDPAGASEMVARAHEEAKRAAEDLRNLVRGIHPSVLDERGLDAALSALVASCSVPVSVEVHLKQRPDPSREAAAYFVVAEGITNVAKHSEARKAMVQIDDDHDVLHIVVEDDGRGGAHLDPSGGLAGLAARVASMDGAFELTSPPGGPTRIEAVIPCGR